MDADVARVASHCLTDVKDLVEEMSRWRFNV